jgi:hypothetical protein
MNAFSDIGSPLLEWTQNDCLDTSSLPNNGTIVKWGGASFSQRKRPRSGQVREAQIFIFYRARRPQGVSPGAVVGYLLRSEA